MDWCTISDQEPHTLEFTNLTKQQKNISLSQSAKQEQELVMNLKNNPDFDSMVPLSQDNPKPQTPSFSFSLSSLPFSFTILLFSIVDSLAYLNLTITYLNNVFNPTIPDNSKVKYFSIVSCLSDISIQYPLWLPKAVLDGTKWNQQLKLKHTWEEHQENGGAGIDGKNDKGVPLQAQEREQRNDGIVPVQSAKQREFLEIMESCNYDEYWFTIFL